MSGCNFLWAIGRECIPEERRARVGRYISASAHGAIYRQDISRRHQQQRGHNRQEDQELDQERDQEKQDVVHMSEDSEVWFVSKSSTTVDFRVKGTGDVSVDGNRLYNQPSSSSNWGNTFDGARRSYFLHTWTGGVSVEYDSEAVEIVRDDYHSTFYRSLLNVDEVNRVLVVDYTSTTAITVANYSYSLPTKMYKSTSTGQCRLTTTTYVDLDVVSNLGVVYVYPMTHGTIPPHHPVDFSRELKFGNYVGKDDPDDLTNFVRSFLSDIKGRLICYVNYKNCSVDQIMELMKVGRFDACFTTSNYVATKLPSRQVLKLTPRATGSPGKFDVISELSEVVERHVFKHPDLQPHHVKVDEQLMGRVLAPIPAEFKSKGATLSGSGGLMNLKSGFEANTAYHVAVVSPGAEVVTWGLAYCDNNGHIHSLFDECMCKKEFMFIKIGPCLIV
ncbi:LOW QUALITY PROTEIN: hypothetical protein ElyMa_001116500 [Elysia marginata]|uniref:Uncharacterized protein n=1 Tax=Elysia marginata TaxID=1093978 RepID=A0AAV4HVD1_9GAST|nr:LOW QUALITY PROTEIN: hypothetical protein ElyMa_001116500 [Elysia marginata]